MLTSAKVRLFAFMCVCAGLCASAQDAVTKDYTVDGQGVATVNVQNLGNDKALAALQAALEDELNRETA